MDQYFLCLRIFIFAINAPFDIKIYLLHTMKTKLLLYQPLVNDAKKILLN